MFDKIKNILAKKPESLHREEVSLQELPAWLDEQEQNCISRRTEAIKASRERIVRFEHDIRQLLEEFGEDISDEPHHHKVEQVNRHALPQFCKKIGVELEGSFSDDDEKFYQEVAGLMDGCFKAFKGPGRYLHHLYPDEIKAFRQILDHMGQELNRMTDIIRLSRERLAHIHQVRDLLESREKLMKESEKAVNEVEQYESLYDSYSKEITRLESELTVCTSSKEYLDFTHLEEEIRATESQIKQTVETFESHLRVAVPVWKRAAKLFQEKGDAENEKRIEELVHLASAPRRQDEEIAYSVSNSSRALFVLFDSGLLLTKNSFEKLLFTTPDEYDEKFRLPIESLKALHEDLERKKKECEMNSSPEKRSSLIHQIENIKDKVRHLQEEERRRVEHVTQMKEDRTHSLQSLREKFEECAGDGFSLGISGEE